VIASVTSRSEQDPSDRALVQAARQGQVRALERLLDRHQSRVLRILRYLGIPGQDREDVAQEVFIRVFRHLKGFRTGQEFGGWLYRVTVNAAHDYRGRRGRLARGEAPWTEGVEHEDPRPGPVESTQGRELRRALEEALGLLSDRERTIFVLREIEGLESRAVARALGITAVTVRRHLSRARRRLRSALGTEKEDQVAASIERIAADGGSHE
jgi:RNA polymerase sigma-70 factor (ECF subfamily)